MNGELPSVSAVADASIDCIFCRIGRGEIPAHVVHEDDHVKAFLDIHPLRPGHVLIIPKAHHDYFDDLPVDLAARVLALGQKLGRLMKTHYGVERAAFLFTGTDVRHVHAHVLPMHEKTDITSPVCIEQAPLRFRMAPRASDDDLRQTAQALSAALVAGGGGR